MAIVDRQKTLLGYQRDEDGNTIVVPRLVRTKQYHEQHVTMDDGSTAIVFRCQECVNHPADAEKLTRQIKLAWIEEMTYAEKSLSEKKQHVEQTRQVQMLGVR